MNDSILNSVKKLLGLPPDYTPFDPDIIIHINTVFSILSQMGIGTDKTFSIAGPDELWSFFIGDNEDVEMVKSYVYLKVRTLFDPPTSSAVAEAINKSISELEYRLYVSEQNRKEHQ